MRVLVIAAVAGALVSGCARPDVEAPPQLHLEYPPHFEKVKWGKHGPVVDCDDIPVVPTPSDGLHSTIRVARIVTEEGGMCGHLSVATGTSEYLPLVQKRLTRVPGCETCYVTHLDWIAIRDVQLAIRYSRPSNRRPEFPSDASPDPHTPPGYDGTYVIEHAEFHYVQHGTREQHLGTLEQRCPGTDRFALDCPLKLYRFASEEDREAQLHEYMQTWPPDRR